MSDRRRDGESTGRPGESGGDVDDRAVYVISVAAELAGVHPQTLRIYERKGLVQPKRTAGNSRRYSARDVARLRMIQRLTQEQGMNLAGVRMMLEMESELARMRRRAERLAAELAEQRRRSREALEHMERRNPPSAIVPLSAARRVRLRLVQRPRPASGRTPIALGPGEENDHTSIPPTRG
jgi:MerR family transcriptional regulator, heat shock protein HspR